MGELFKIESYHLSLDQQTVVPSRPTFIRVSSYVRAYVIARAHLNNPTEPIVLVLTGEDDVPEDAEVLDGGETGESGIVASHDVRSSLHQE